MIENGHKIIFEGAELSGKSYLMSQVYKYLEPKYNSGGNVLDGCHWFNLDVGVYGTTNGARMVEKYLEVLQVLREKNVLVEKFYLTEAVYQKMYNNIDYDYTTIENKLADMNTKIVLLTFDEDEDLIKARLKDRLELYPHYERIAHEPAHYFEQQRLYKEHIAKSKIKNIVINSSHLPDQRLEEKIIDFIES